MSNKCKNLLNIKISLFTNKNIPVIIATRDGSGLHEKPLTYHMQNHT